MAARIGNPYLRRLRDDAPFRTRLTLYGVLAVNLAYAAWNAVLGVYWHSPWFGTLAAYYILLSAMRLPLARYVRAHGFGRDPAAEYRRYRLCGVMLAVLGLPLVGVIVLALHYEMRLEYPGTMIYAAAAYTFCITVLAIVNEVKYRRSDSPALWALGHVSLATALVSMLSLEVAMIERFGEGDQEGFRLTMIAVSGGALCLCVTVLGIHMAALATRRLLTIAQQPGAIPDATGHDDVAGGVGVCER